MADDTSARIKRIDEISSPARTAWFTLLGVLAFVAVTLLSVTHADILLNSRMIALPVVGVSVPTNLFLLLTPVVLTVLYANLHLYLLKLWQAFRRAPTDAELGDDRSLADEVQPWLVNDYALTLKNGTTPGDHHRTLLRNVITLFTVWWAPLGVLGWMWYVALLTRDLRVILVILACDRRLRAWSGCTAGSAPTAGCASGTAARSRSSPTPSSRRSRSSASSRAGTRR